MFQLTLFKYLQAKYERFRSLKQTIEALHRNMFKLVLLSLMGSAALLIEQTYPLVLGDTFAPLTRGFGLTFLGLSAGFLAQCVLEPYLSSQELLRRVVEEKNMGAGLMYVGRCIVLAIVLILMATSSRAADTKLPANAVAKLPVFKQEILTHWPELTLRSYLGGQIEQETCITLKHRSCWSENAQLLTSREQGVGLGQLTRAFQG